jgi:hypothetical protein
LGWFSNMDKLCNDNIPSKAALVLRRHFSYVNLNIVATNRYYGKIGGLSASATDDKQDIVNKIVK